MIGRDDILALIPHQGAMCLWDEVVDWDAQRIRLRAIHATAGGKRCFVGAASAANFKPANGCFCGSDGSRDILKIARICRDFRRSHKNPLAKGSWLTPLPRKPA